MSWRALAAEAPDLAAAGRERFERANVALLGTIRRDGSPRISPVEPYFLADELVFGVMRSPKWDDLRRDPHCVLHSAVTDVNGSEGEFKVYGRAQTVSDEAILGAASAWWLGRPRDGVGVYAIEIEEAVLVGWDPDFGRMRTTRWTAGGGVQETTRTYP